MLEAVDGTQVEAAAADQSDVLILVQGKTAVIELPGPPGMTLTGALLGRPLHFFFQQPEGVYVAYQGVHALTEPGLYPLVVTAALPDGGPFTLSQTALVQAGRFALDPPLNVSPETIDVSITAPEDAFWDALARPVTPEQHWKRSLGDPLPRKQGFSISSRFGSRRSYNGSAALHFHSGLDFRAGSGVKVSAAAAGTVVFAGPLTVRGMAVMIDHGRSVYTGYLHQSNLLVKPGQRVKAGQLIGRVGASGRVTGPHLHFEVWVGGVQVDPLDWLV